MNRAVKAIISVILTIILSYGLVLAWTNLSTVNTGDGLTATIWNAMVTKINDIGARTDGIYNSSGNIGIGVASPTSKLDIGGTAGVDGVRFPDGTIQTTAFGSNVIINVLPTNGSTSYFSFNIPDASTSIGTTNSTTDLFTFSKSGTYMVYAWAESGFTSWQPVVNGTPYLTHNYSAAEDVLATYIFNASVGTTFKFAFTTNHTNALTGYNYNIVRLGD